MKVYIDRSSCSLCNAYCDRHAARFVRFPLSEERPCITAIEDDGQELLTLAVKDNGNEATLTLTEEQREIVALEGLTVLLPWYQH
ncbi:MAG TPA: hypothetical protein VI547_07840 [Anaerolineales bacterium]|nr:hypothetical protein [Anaerolineales bacterium]